MTSDLKSNLSPEEDSRRLVQATKKYLHGEITVEQFEELERQYMTDYRSALIAVGKQRAAFESRNKKALKF